MQNNSRQDKVALVTGGARRLGAVIARRLHQAGMRVVIHYRDSRADAEALQASLNAARPHSAALAQAELLDVDAVRGLVDTCIRAFGRLDVVVNNASSFYPTPLGEASARDWQNLMGTNLKAPFFLVQEAAAELRRSRGSVVNMVDVYGNTPLKDHVIYSTAKAGLIALTRALAADLAPDVRVNAVAPGAILWPEGDAADATGQERILAATPLHRTGTPGEIAEAVVFLAQSAGFTTGHVLPVDGGRGLKG